MCLCSTFSYKFHHVIMGTIEVYILVLHFMILKMFSRHLGFESIFKWYIDQFDPLLVKSEFSGAIEFP